MSAFHAYSNSPYNYQIELRKLYDSKFEDFKKYIPLDCVKYLVSIEFDPDSLPWLIRDHYQEFFEILSAESLKNTEGFITFMRNKEKPLKEVLKDSEKPKTGFIYCFITTLKASTSGFKVIKVGRTEAIEKRLKEHKGSKLLADYSFIMTTHSLDIKADENLLLDWLKSQEICLPYLTEDKELKKELCEMPEFHIEPLFKEFLNQRKV